MGLARPVVAYFRRGERHRRRVDRSARRSRSDGGAAGTRAYTRYAQAPDANRLGAKSGIANLGRGRATLAAPLWFRLPPAVVADEWSLRARRGLWSVDGVRIQRGRQSSAA